jgi:hypothetical protein
MATKLFTIRTNINVNGSDYELLSLTAGAAQTNGVPTNTAAGPATITFNASGSASSTTLRCMSNRLTGVTISGTITANLWALESAMAANAGASILVRRCDLDGTPISTILDSAKGTEFGTAIAAQNWAPTPTSTTLSDGDRIRVDWRFTDAGGTMASGNTCTASYSGPTGAADGDTWLQFTETITEFTAPAERVPRFTPYPQLLAH